MTPATSVCQFAQFANSHSSKLDAVCSSVSLRVLLSTQTETDCMQMADTRGSVTLKHSRKLNCEVIETPNHVTQGHRARRQQVRHRVGSKSNPNPVQGIYWGRS